MSTNQIVEPVLEAVSRTVEIIFARYIVLAFPKRTEAK
jgi:hypothetical protein